MIPSVFPKGIIGPGSAFQKGGAGGGLIMDQIPDGLNVYAFENAVGAYSGAVTRLRRADGALSDFTESDLKGGAAATWASGQDAFVHTVYDQLGGLNWVQSNDSLQPKLITAGAVEVENEFPFAQFAANDYWQAASVSAIAGDFTFLTWVRFGGAWAEALLSKIVGNQNFIWLRSSTAWDFRAAGTLTSITHGHTGTLGSLVHLGVVRQSGEIRFYLDTTPPTGTATNANEFQYDGFGVYNVSDRPFTGKFGGAYIWGRALSVSEIQNHFFATQP